LNYNCKQNIYFPVGFKTKEMAKLIAVQQPQSTFHKDEGGKTNNLSFRVLLQGDIDVSTGGAKGEIPLDVVAVYEDGTPVPRQEQIITITGCTEKPNGGPCLCLVSRLGGVLYRLQQVSKRLDDKPVCVRISLRGCPDVEPIQSQGTMVFSKRKNRTQREEQQAREREEMERREAEAASLLVQKMNGNGGDSNDRPQKMVKFDVPSGASSMYDTADTDECSSTGVNSSVLETLLRRVSELEKTVVDQQRAIDELRIFMPGPPQAGRRSTSQALWGIPSTVAPITNFFFPPTLRRDTSTESFPDLPQLGQ
jgi:hypothetical protein